MTRIDVHGAFWAGVALTAATLIAQAFAQTPTDKPRVPPGVDPGGVAVAIIGSGIDYTNPEIAKRLARDGEGEIIGWDFIDNDRRPYATCAPPGSGTVCHLLQLVTLIEAKPLIRIAPFRASLANPQSLVASVQAIARTDIRIVALMLDPPPPHAFLLDAAKRFPALAFVGSVAEPENPATTSGNVIAIPAVALSAGDNLGDMPSRANFVTAAVATLAAQCTTSRATPPEVIACTTALAGLRQ